MSPMVTRKNSWFEMIGNVLVIGNDSIDLSIVHAIDASVDDDTEEDDLVDIEMYHGTEGSWTTRRKYTKKYWDLEMHELITTWARLRNNREVKR